MEVNYIIVQAGGKGTRLKHLTKNRPKALVPIGNLPILFHLFQKYPDKNYIIIGDYKEEVLRKYLAVFADVKHIVVSAAGHSGTCSGIKSALGKIPSKEAFLLIWSDLILPENFSIPEKEGDYIGIAKDFPCRWSYIDGEMEEISSKNLGIAGLFIFQDKTILDGIAENGEFVRWLKERNVGLEPLTLYKTREYGILETVPVQEKQRCRSFNRITVKEGKVYKEGINAQGRKLAVREKAWYQHVQEIGLKNIPQIYSYAPSIIMEKIDGKNVYEYSLSYEEKTVVLKELVQCLKELHTYGRKPPDYFSIQEAYYKKTVGRLAKVRDMIPFNREPYILVNGRKCRNVFWHLEELEKLVESLECKEFQLIHGDCTFSNIILRDGKVPVLIDPRGYFGHSEIYGDSLYDWAKLYYSLYGNYDQFNLRHFQLEIREDEVLLEIASNHWEDMQQEFFRLVGDDVSEADIKLVHAIIWLSLTTYTWEDYDSICGAFYNGIYYLEELLG